MEETASRQAESRVCAEGVFRPPEAVSAGARLPAKFVGLESALSAGRWLCESGAPPRGWATDACLFFCQRSYSPLLRRSKWGDRERAGMVLSLL